MKHKYMVEFRLPQIMGTEFYSLIPDQRLKVAHFFDQNVLQSYSLNNDRTKLWAIFFGSSEQEIEEKIQQLPLTVFMEYEICELMFHETINRVLPHFSLN
ncbi:hypothetical protein OAQ99_04915 [Candidatus Kapabacteria bacterium]|nr:hypothetical protein [Candidatus Kapabacteria bacterium]